MNSIYLDNAATSWPKPDCVYDAVDSFNRKMGGSPGRGSNSRSIEAGTIVLQTREALARLFNVSDSSRIVFTSGVTESINVGFKGVLNPGDGVIISGMEHNAVARPLHELQKNGVEVSIAPCAPDGTLDPKALELLIRKNTRMICMLHASNLTGTIMPIAEAGRVARDNGVLFMVDSAQTAGVLEIDVEKQNIDLLAFTGHKSLFGLQGTGGLYIRPGLEVRTLKEGGTGSLSEHTFQPDFLPDRFESGTLNTPGLAGLGAGIGFILQNGVKKIHDHERELTDTLINGLKEIKGLTLYGPADIRLRTAVVSFNVKGMECGEVSFILDQKHGIICRSGLHCAPMAHRTSGTLELGAVRLSPGYFNTREEIEKVIEVIHGIASGADK
ncbi:MAG: aminotransferase class V-fold PLP-dependent enzyme [Firmicutes bacterium]|nr:aminotransferase class V-fold PLP-dependent enzyme [Bacillota bacterium]